MYISLHVKYYLFLSHFD